MKYNVGDHAVIRIGRDWYPAIYGKASHVPLYGWVRSDVLRDENDVDIEIEVDHYILTDTEWFSSRVYSNLDGLEYDSLRSRVQYARGLSDAFRWVIDNA